MYPVCLFWVSMQAVIPFGFISRIVGEKLFSSYGNCNCSHRYSENDSRLPPAYGKYSGYSAAFSLLLLDIWPWHALCNWFSMEYLKTDAGVPGFTTIFSSVTRPAEVDIMFVHGAYGSPINSFAGDCTAPALDGNEQEFWPSDRLPERLESLGVFPRVLTYGWRANAWLDSDTSISKLAGIFAQDIYEERSATPERPLVFIGHGLGGLLIKETISNMVMRGHQNGRREFCVRACFFFAVPQQGLDHPLNFAPLLARMACVLQKINPVGPYARMLASELEPRNKILIDLSREFAVTQRKHSISVFSFAESVKTQGHFVVPEKSAFCVTDPQNCYLLDANYRNIAALSRVEKNLETVLEHICGSITRYFPDRHL